MPPSTDQPGPQGPKPEPKPPVGAIDPKSLLLPKKETTPNKDSAQRINAGALLASETSATLLTPEGTAKQVPVPAKPVAPANKKPAVEESSIKSLQTYRGDIETMVTDKNVSVLNIAAAEANRRGESPSPMPAEEKKPISMTLMMIAGGLLLLVAAAGVLAVVLTRPTSLPSVESPKAPFINIDDAVAVIVGAGKTRDNVMAELQLARTETKISLGLVQWLYIGHPATGDTAAASYTGSEFLSLIAPNIPPELVRTIQPTFLLGIHSFDENQPFLLLQVDSYGTAYSGMLAWERTMQGDLSPLFVRNPSVRPAGSVVEMTATTSQQFVPTGFVDKIVENRDTRALLSPQGDILLLWTFLGRNNILITTNEYTLREVVSRINSSPVIPAVGR